MVDSLVVKWVACWVAHSAERKAACWVERWVDQLAAKKAAEMVV